MTVSGACLAVDGGGTRCRFALMWDGHRHELLGPGANVSTDFTQSLEVLRNGFASLAADAGMTCDALYSVPTYLGLAGVIDAATAARVAAALPFATLRVEEDRPAALTGALEAGFGCVAAVGTGSFLGRADAGGVRFIGGHGMVLGDEASGAWLGRSVLIRSLHAIDGIAPDSELCAGLRERLGGAVGLINFARSATPGQFAAFAPEVVAAADSGDAVARELMAEGGGYLARCLCALGWQEGERLCLMGGLGPSYARWLTPGMQAALMPPVGSALDGALTLAARLARGEVQ
ncbi:BadF/BadG/BcrA/BcrD ATPase family protein [Puniceibacterium sediminis]|nr:BadF/BadG/BcrA/BcrD ATPase family protein [Puniceibacterium sediminis]